MIPNVFSLQEAQQFFLFHSEGKVNCNKGDKSKICDTYPEAESFYKS